jgi:hypothetical protein
MRSIRVLPTVLVACALAVTVGLSLVRHASSHCDTLDGPVVTDAKTAFAKSDVTPVLKWVTPQNEAEIRSAFASAVAVRKESKEAAALADRYFFETLVRVHREGEGAPYTGLKDEPADPVIAMADGALASGSAGEMVSQLQAHMASALREKYATVARAAKDRDKSVEAGRQYVAAYVTYMHYVEAVHASIVSAGDEHGAALETPAHRD